MQARRFFLIVCMSIVVLSMSLTSCSGGGGSRSTPGTGEEHSIPSQQAGYPVDGGAATPEPGYPQP